MIRIVCADLSGGTPQMYDRLYALASPERKQRADRYRRQDDKLRCVAADALLRNALGTADYTVAKHRYGKPYLPEYPDFHFNLSHSGRYAVLAWGTPEMGIDVQEHNPGTDFAALAAFGFAPDERDYVFRSEAHMQQRFYEIWTGKESYLKYIGKGLGMDLRSFSVLRPAPDIRYLRPSFDEGYSLCLCTTENQFTFELLNIRQLL